MGLAYLLDTNILSEPVRPLPNENVMRQLEKYSGDFCTSSTVWHELKFGVERLVSSKRKGILSSYLEALEHGGLIVLPFDKLAGEWLAHQRAILTGKGIATSIFDGQIAAVAAINNVTVVTRNTADFSMYEGLVRENWFD